MFGHLSLIAPLGLQVTIIFSSDHTILRKEEEGESLEGNKSNRVVRVIVLG